MVWNLPAETRMLKLKHFNLEQCKNNNTMFNKIKYRPVTSIFLGIYIMIGIISIIVTCIRLRRGVTLEKGCNNIFLRRHMIYVLSFTIIYFFSMVSTGIFTGCYFMYRDQLGEDPGNNEIYNKCFEGAKYKGLLIAFTNVFIR